MRWSAFDVFVRLGMQFGISIVLARLLTPEDFGVIAMLSLFMGVAGIFADSGFGSALNQRQNTTHTDESTVFFFNLGMGALAALLLCAAAPWIAEFFKQPVLQQLTYAMAFNLFLGVFGAIHTTLLNKEMNYKVITKVGVFSSMAGGAVAIYMASQGYGVWSLAGFALVSSIVTVMLLWLWHPWRPACVFSIASLRSLFNFGGYAMASSLLDVFATNLNAILIGKLYSVRDAGLFERAQRTQQMPASIMMGVVNRVAFSTFASVAEDKARLARGLRQALSIAMFVNIPASVGMIILAEPLILTLLGTQWLPCVPILQVLGLCGLLVPLHSLNLNILRAQGRTDLNFRIAMLKKTFAISLVAISSLFGVMAMAWAQLVISIFAYFLNTRYTNILLGYSGWKQLSDLKMNFVVAMPMSLVVYFMNQMLQVAPIFKLITISICGAVIYLLTCRLLCNDLLVQFLNMAGLKQKHAQPSAPLD